MIYPYWGMDINPFMEFCISIEGTSIVAWTAWTMGDYVGNSLFKFLLR